MYKSPGGNCRRGVSLQCEVKLLGMEQKHMCKKAISLIVIMLMLLAGCTSENETIESLDSYSTESSSAPSETTESTESTNWTAEEMECTFPVGAILDQEANESASESATTAIPNETTISETIDQVITENHIENTMPEMESTETAPEVPVDTIPMETESEPTIPNMLPMG